MKVSESRTLALRLLVALTGLYILLTGGHIYSPDGTVMYRLTRAVVDDGELAFEPLLFHEEFGGPSAPSTEEENTRRYSKYGPGLSILAIPPYLASRALLPLTTPAEQDVFHTSATLEGPLSWMSATPPRDPDIRSFRRLWYPTKSSSFEEAFGAFFVSLLNPLIVAGTCTLLFLLLCELGLALTTALGGAAIIALASPLLHYSRTFWSEPLAALAVTGMAWGLARYNRNQHTRELVGIGGFLGLLAATKLALAVLALPLFVALGLTSPRSPRAMARWSLPICAGALPGFALVLLYNVLRFGTAFETGYDSTTDNWSTPFAEGFLGLLFSPGRGLLLHCPIVLGFFFGLRGFWKKHPELAAFSSGCLLTLIGLYCCWFEWGGSWCWGPRFLVPVMPLLVLPVALILDAPNTPRRTRLGLKCLIVISGIVAINGILVNPHDYYQWLKGLFLAHQDNFHREGITHHFELLYWDWSYAPLVRWWNFPVSETQLMPWALTKPGVVAGVYGLAFAALVTGVLGLRAALSRVTTKAMP